MVGVTDGDRQWVTERCRSFLERDTMLAEIACRLSWMPFEVHQIRFVRSDAGVKFKSEFAEFTMMTGAALQRPKSPGRSRSFRRRPYCLLVTQGGKLEKCSKQHFSGK